MSAPAGWYSDPEMVNTRRYWDGEQWTAHRQETQAVAALDRTPAYQLLDPGSRDRVRDNGNNWTDWGYVLAVIAPLLGLIIGLTQLGNEPRHAGRIIGLSVAAVIVWVVLVTALG